jgi:ATP-dependent DNA ligase
VRLFTRRGYDWIATYPLIREAVAAIPARSVIIDGEAVYCDNAGSQKWNASAQKPCVLC